MTRYNLNFRVFEQRIANPKNALEAEANRSPIEVKIPLKDRVVRGRNVDVCRAMARDYVEKTLRRRVRSVSIGPEGIFVVVYPQGVNLKRGKPISEKALRRRLSR